MSDNQDTRDFEDAPPPPPADDVETHALPTTNEPETTAVPPQDGPEEMPTAAASHTRRLTRANKVVIAAAAGVLVLAGAYVGTAWYLQDKIPNNTRVDGVTIGGLSADAAVDTLNTHYGSVALEPLEVAVGESTAELDPAQVGLHVDAAATIADLTGFSLNPARLWQHVTGFGDLSPVSTIDEEAATEELQALSEILDVAPVDGAIAFEDGQAVVTEAVEGKSVDVPAAVEVIRTQWLETSGAIELPVTVTEPDITQAEVDEAMTTLVEPLLAGPVTVTADDLSQDLPVEQLAAAATVSASDGVLTLQLDGEALLNQLIDDNSDFSSAGTDAQIVIKNGAPTVIPSESGRGVTAADLASAVQDALATTDRVAAVEFTEMEADFTTEEAEALGVTEIVSEFSTPLYYNPDRTTNLVVGTSKITNTLLKPGETFSLIEALGPINESTGFKNSGVVVDGFTVEGMGGGLSQLSTTTYNAAFFAGMDLVEHTPHSKWYSRYPEGRESTLWVDTIDMKFKNPTPYGALVEAWVEDNETVWVRIWSTKYFEVETTTSDRYNITYPETVYNTSANCEPETGGQTGFTVTVTRQRYLDGEEYSDESWTWTYQPWNNVVCGSAPSDDSDDS